MGWQDGSWELCIIYLGRLPGGEVSPGYRKNGADGKPGVYVCRKADWEDRNVGGPTSETPPNLSSMSGTSVPSEETWASKYVRYVRVDNDVGKSASTINEEYDVLVSSPFGSANHGVIVKKAGTKPPAASVWDGETEYDKSLRRLTDRNTPIMDRARLARQMYGDPLATAEGAPYPAGQYGYPADKEVWL